MVVRATLSLMPKILFLNIRKIEVTQLKENSLQIIKVKAKALMVILKNKR